jgi:hypothetical protein
MEVKLVATRPLRFKIRVGAEAGVCDGEGQRHMRERGPRIRRRGLGRFVVRHRLIWLLGAGGAILLSGVDAFGDAEQASPPQLLAFWFGVMFAGGVTAALGIEALEARPVANMAPALKALVLTLAVTVAITPICWLFSALALHGSWDPGRIISISSQVLLVAAVLVPLQLMIDRAGAAPARRSTIPPGEGLLDRLPLGLRAAELHAVSVEDHYLRCHTSAGSGLVLMSLERALPLLEGGARTHRSWWVARNAVLGATRGRGRAVLHLKNGLRAPVSRSYAPRLRLEGWF